MKKITKTELKRRIIQSAIREGKQVTIRFPRGKGITQYSEDGIEEWTMDPREIAGDFVRGFLLPGPNGTETESSLNYARASFISLR